MDVIDGRDHEKAHGTWVKKVRLYQLVGYAWVLTFLFWSVPKWEYEKIHCVISRVA